MPSVAPTFIVVIISAASTWSSFATATAAPIGPEVACGWNTSFSLDARLTRDEAS